jgi:putative tributyrin esterase
MAWIQVHCNSAQLKMPVDFQVLMPQHNPEGGKGAVRGKGPYKALYLLHGLGGSGTEWLRNTSLERHMSRIPMAVVLPDGHNSFWTNMTTGSNYHDFVTSELPAICEKWFNISPRREDKYIAGISMGGYGALNAALNNPRAFSKVAAISPVTDMALFFGRDDLTVKPEWIFGGYEKYASGRDNLLIAANKLAEDAGKDGERPEILLTCGHGDGFYQPTLSFKEHLDGLGIRNEFYDTEGEHDWEYGDMAIKKVIDWLGAQREED